MKKTSKTVFTLWAIGYIVALVSLTGFIGTLLRPDCGSSLTCQLENAFIQSTALLGIFAGAIFVVLGFWKRAKENSTEQENDFI